MFAAEHTHTGRRSGSNRESTFTVAHVPWNPRKSITEAGEMSVADISMKFLAWDQSTDSPNRSTSTGLNSTPPELPS